MVRGPLLLLLLVLLMFLLLAVMVLAPVLLSPSTGDGGDRERPCRLERCWPNLAAVAPISDGGDNLLAGSPSKPADSKALRGLARLDLGPIWWVPVLLACCRSGPLDTDEEWFACNEWWRRCC